ncbi:TolC family protein [Porifericola rhodea]|uniref:TolC family protein n=1 Tax=Porifericola rhodea TaxID=930972 RepID=UPI002667078A|nr:TolC family protein [Porifericola rhodea]WKN29711.1 TolC family protein [Porifericola rhodea]
MKIVITSLLIWLPLHLSMAQHVLQQYVEEGVANNLALQQEELSLKKSIEVLQQAKANFLPQLSFEASYTAASGGRTINFPVGDLFNPIHATLNQITDSQNYPTDLENVNEQFLPNNFHDTRLSLRQPLLNTDIYYGYRARQKMVKVQQAQHDAYRQQLIKEIKSAYYDYLQSLELISVYDSTELLLKELLRVNRVLVKNDKATEEVIYEAEYELQNLFAQSQTALQQSQAAKNYFNFLLNKELEAEIIVDKNLYDLPLLPKILEELQQSALANRYELKQAEKGLLTTEALLQLQKNKKLPQLSLGILSGYQGFGYSFDENQDYVLAQFNLSVPIFSGGKINSAKQEAQLQLQSAQQQIAQIESQIQLQVSHAYHQFRTAQASYTAKLRAVKSAEKSFEITQTKYKLQQALLLELLESRNRYTNAQLELVIARYQWYKAEAMLEWAAQL